ncbi:prolipoprotein diacylglyceryl transferase [Sedimentibacter sp. zth1]|uniref:prolipoprotein diacylglyceryl transferase n=1 Tax=Sedimentibacter sp. zth1 TaxID=2816908 RepID=UPI001A9241C6|nr:prolipoprotein diacylglyceryl transferase [Sedimentibacter sp. zth1]QSX06143.1 prolipoprotein diacylglyceryl transferase [Sedimentibacter sp. zth1]
MDKNAFTLLGIDIKWYGVIIASAFLIGVFLSIKECRRIGFKEDTLIDFLLVIVPVGIICARLYYVAFEWRQYINDPIQILNFRAGGLAIHGGIIGGAIAGMIFCKVKKIRFFQIIDIITPAVVLGQGLGRWGNFINEEAHGGPTDLPWGILVNGQKVHPTFLYESIADVLIFLFLIWYRKHKRKNEGEVLALYFILYSAVRFFIESLRTDSLMFLGLKTAQLVSIGLIIIGIGLFIFVRVNGKTKTDRLQ